MTGTLSRPWSRTSGRGPSGYSLLELMLVISLGVILLGIGFHVIYSARSRGGPRWIAMQLLADLRWAQQKALAQSRPWGILLPEGSLGQAYAVVGADMNTPGRMTVHRIVTTTETSPPPAIFAGTWHELPFSPASEVTPWGTPDPLVLRLREQWVQKWPGRYVMFAGDGRLTTPDLPHVEGDRFLVVCAGARATGDVLRETGPAYTLRISPHGEASLESGVPGRRDASDPVPLGAVASLPPDLPKSGDGTTPPPSGLTLEARPTANPMSLPPGAASGRTFQVRQDGTLSLTVSSSLGAGIASRPVCTWGGREMGRSTDAASPPDPDTQFNPSPGPGRYSVLGPQPMCWDETSGNGRWVHGVEWQPPVGALPGQWYSVGAMVEAPDGGRTASWVAVEVIEAGAARMAWQEAGSGACFVGSVAGTETTRIPAIGKEEFPLGFGPDGTWLLLNSGGGLRAVHTETLEDDGLSRGVPPGPVPIVSISPFGNMVAFVQNPNALGTGTLFVTHWDGSGAASLSTRGRAPGWGPDGRLGYCEVDPSQTPFGHSLFVYDPRYGIRTWASQSTLSFATLWFPSTNPARIMALQNYTPFNLGLLTLLGVPTAAGVNMHMFRERAVIEPPPSKNFWGNIDNMAEIQETIANVAYEPGANCGSAAYSRFTWSPDRAWVAWNWVAPGDSTPRLSFSRVNPDAIYQRTVMEGTRSDVGQCWTNAWSRDSAGILTMHGNPGAFSAVVVDTRTGVLRTLLQNVNWVVWAR